VIFAGIKISGALERIGDYAENIGQAPPCCPGHCPHAAVVRRRPRMARLVQREPQDRRSTPSRDDRRREGAARCGSSDEDIDAASTPALFRELITYMMEDPRNITALHAPAVHRQEHRARRRSRRPTSPSWQLPVTPDCGEAAAQERAGLRHGHA
jgi:phosphate uptake regulator